jgi:predicted phage terminase large subunit-like protein
MEIKPQEGPQTDFLSSEADIVIYGGAAGGGKTFGMLLDPLRHIESAPNGGAVYFRRTTPQIKNQGGLWDSAKELYHQIGGEARESPSLDIVFPHPTDKKKTGFKITFSHLQHEKDKLNYQGAQIPVIYFDELTHFTRTQFMYLVGRNRSTCGIKPYLRASCNPDKTSWVRQFIDWWIADDGYADLERSGKIRWLCVYEDKDYWFDTKEEALSHFGYDENGDPSIPPLSVTFILSRLKDNKILMEKDPGYKAKLMSLSKVERERLLGDGERGGNWDIVPAAGMFFKRHYFQEVEHCPPLSKIVRCWDRAATEWNEGDSESKKPDATAGVKMGKTTDGQIIILDCEHERYSPGKVDNLILNVARQDGIGTTVKGFQDPGSAGKGESHNFVKMLSGFDVVVDRIATDKVTAAKPMSSFAEQLGILILSSCKNKEKLYSELENFPDDAHDDIVDACSGAFNELNADNVGEFTSAYNQDSIENDNNLNQELPW